jgi:1-acyl-sn-glycerol-3-phosphate acyltransferase
MGDWDPDKELRPVPSGTGTVFIGKRVNMRAMNSAKRFGFLILSLFLWVYIATVTILATTGIAAVHLFDPKQKVAHKIATLWGKSIFAVNPLWHLKITGRTHIKKNQRYILVANHNSLADIICVYCLGKQFKWIAKESLFKVPVFGWAMSFLKYIPLRRGEHGSIREAMTLAEQTLADNISLLFFPEGTRSRNAELGAFKSGAFKLAIQTKTPIVPIIIAGTERVLEKGTATMTARANGVIKVLPKVDVTEYGPGQTNELKARVRKLMGEELKKLA